MQIEAHLGEAAAQPAAARPAGLSQPLSESVMAIPVSVEVVIGSTRLPIARIADLGTGSVIGLDQKLGAPVTVLVNGSPVAKGDLYVLDGEDGRLAITITDVAPTAKSLPPP